MTVGAYREVPAFAYPGWRLTVPGGPAGGQYKGFTHTQGAGTDLEPQDQYEQDREDGMSSHDAVHATPRNPRGVYRSSAEVAPRPNASGRAHSLRSFQTARHAGTSVAPGSFPADFFETGEDDFLSLAENVGRSLQGLGALPLRSAAMYDGGGPFYPSGIVSSEPDLPILGPAPISAPKLVVSAPDLPVNQPPLFGPPTLVTSAPDLPIFGPNTVATPPPPTIAAASNLPVSQRIVRGPLMYIDGGPSAAPFAPSGVVTSAPDLPVNIPPQPGVVAQPPPTQPAPPSPSVPVAVAPPVSPAPAPTVPTNQVVPLNDGSGNYLNLSTGLTVPPADVTQNPATGQLVQTSSGFDPLTWLEQPSSLFPSIPNWGLVAGAAVAAAMLMGGGSGRRR